MHVNTGNVYPDCPTIIRTVDVGGLTKAELIQQLQSHSISMNESGERLFADGRFTISETRYSVTTVELTIRNLDFPRGAPIAEIYERAAELGLSLCPLELGPHLRLQYLDQSEGFWGKPVRRHQAPYGSITIASKTLTDDDDFPKGFYLRRIENVPWLRGYCSGADHVWEPDDHFIFVKQRELRPSHDNDKIQP